MAKTNTTIAINKRTRNRLFRLKESPDDTYDDVIRALIDEEED